MRRAAALAITLVRVVAPAAALAIILVCAANAPAAAAHHSLYDGPGPRPGPAILYAAPATAPQLTNASPWQAPPILVSGTTAYRDHEFLYQDFLYDDHGAREVADPHDPRAADWANLFSKPNGTYTYPTGPGYDNDAADLVEFRVKPLPGATAFRITLNTLANPLLIAFSIAIGGRPGHVFRFPDGANVVAPAALFLTVHPSGSRLVASLVHAGRDKPVHGPAPRVAVDLHRRQITVEIPHSDWNPARATVRLAMGVGLWNRARGRYLLPGATATATRPGGAGSDRHPAAFFNVAFRTQEPLQGDTGGSQFMVDAAWWRDRGQGTALARGNISRFFADVSFAKLARGGWDDSEVPRTGPMDRILASHFAIAQGAQFTHQCGLAGAADPSLCVAEYEGNLQPYAMYVPPGKPPSGGYGLTLLLHSASANYNEYLGSRIETQFADRAIPSIVITPEARGPDLQYEGVGAADVFEAWADVARHFPLDPTYSDITGYSMGGIGTFRLAAEFPDLFARAQPTVGGESNNYVLASLRNVPVLMWNDSGDELVTPAVYKPTATRLARLGYRFQLDVFRPCKVAACSPVLPNHLQLAINDQFAPAAGFLGAAVVDRDPAHVTYVVDGARNRPALGLVGDHAYWLSGLTLRDPHRTSSSGDPEGEIDAVSHGFGVGPPTPSGVVRGKGKLTGGNLGTLRFASYTQTWGPAPATARRDSIEIRATNIATASIDVERADVDCRVSLHIHTDGPLTITLPGCRRRIKAV